MQSCNVNADHTNFEVFLRNFNLEFEKDKIFDPHELHFDQEIRDLNDEHVTWLYNKIEKNFENARFWFTATPIIGYIDSEKIYIADGNHRLAAAQRFNELNGSKKINNFPVSFLILSKITHAQKLVLMSMAEEKVYENRKPLTKYEILKNARILLKNCPEVLKLPPLPENATTSEQNDYSKKCVQAIMGFFHVCHPSLVLSNIWKATRITDNDFDKMYPHFKNLPSGFDVNDFDVVFNKYLLSPIKITELMTMEKFPKLEIFRKMLRKDVKKEVIPLLKHLKAYEYSWDDFQHMKFIAGEKYVTSQGTNHTNTVLQHYLSAKGRELRHHKTVSKKLMYLQKHFSLWQNKQKRESKTLRVSKSAHNKTKKTSSNIAAMPNSSITNSTKDEKHKEFLNFLVQTDREAIAALLFHYVIRASSPEACRPSYYSKYLKDDKFMLTKLPRNDGKTDDEMLDTDEFGDFSYFNVTRNISKEIASKNSVEKSVHYSHFVDNCCGDY